MIKVVIHKAYGGFYSKELDEELLKVNKDIHNIYRADPDLVRIIEEFGLLNYKIVHVPENVKWHIEEYDGIEWVAEDHRTWS